MNESIAATMHWRGLLRLPSFRTAFVGSLAVLLAFATWVFVDSSFYMTLDLSSWMNLWAGVISRLLLFVALAVAGAAFTFVVLYRLLFGDHKGRSLRSLMLAVTLTGMWLGLFTSYDGLREVGFRWRVRQLLPELKQDASILLSEWPTKDGSLPFLGEFAIDKETLGLDTFGQWQAIMPLGPLDPSKPRPVRAMVWPLIYKKNDGRLFFCMMSKGYRTWVEYRPDESEPNLFFKTVRFDGSTSEVSLTSIQLEAHWFLVWNISPPEVFMDEDLRRLNP
jgi:hypothetical protein